MFRPLTIEEEPITFRPVPGYEEEWASRENPEPQPIWLYLGTYPLVGYIVVWMALLGAVLLGG
jgi:hypothetical protein